MIHYSISDLQDPTSPEGSWFLFNANDSYQKKKNRRKNCKRCSKNIPMPKEGPPGPQGPRGPQGPQGESGGTLSLGEIEDYIKTYVTDLLIQNKTISLDFLKPKRRRSSFKENVPVVFTGQLPYKEKIPSQQTSVIKGFTVTFGPGQFKRGVIVRGGKFTITREGVYQVSGTIPIQQSKKFNDSSPHTGDKTISLYLCVDNCLKDRRLKWTSSFSGRTSAVFNGHVRLKRGQSMMVLMSNPTSFDVDVLPGSTFSAALLGT
ncbi:hypothetical protein Anas_08322 [Armadillidium nasatum]|uniref:Uncharacterized protein n=1 Tax=Armadillidium nasatum TaxID=96803 RepID=A0A5N5STZ1_9CRUS|nr:hypothetical protein Anas_08322 [Armadillidium nasatum]